MDFLQAVGFEAFGAVIKGGVGLGSGGAAFLFVGGCWVSVAEIWRERLAVLLVGGSFVFGLTEIVDDEAFDD